MIIATGLAALAQCAPLALIARSATYTVVSGDTGYNIAAKEGTTFSALDAANPGVTWTNLQIGQVLQLPSGGSAATTTAAAISAAAYTTAAASATAAGSPAATSSSSQSSEPSITSSSKVSNSLAVLTVNDQDGKGSCPDSYTMHTGDGSTSAGWPAVSDWASFDDMWNANVAVMGQNCVGGVASNSADENSQIKSAIEAVALASAVDHRFILATMMQESNGCVRVPTTNWGVRNPGLMQDHDGSGTCNEGSVQNPCPASEIYQMIQDGVMGTAAGDGSVQTLSQAVTKGGSGAQAFYMAARIYNSGSVVQGDLGAGVATHCYASDIANRLTGWVKASST